MLNWLESMQMKEDKKGWMELQVAMLPLVIDLGLFMGEGWKSLAGSTKLCFQFAIHLPQLLSTPDAEQFERQTYSTPISLKIAILDLVMWNKGLQDTIPHDSKMCQGDSISPIANIPKMGWEEWERPGITKAKPRDGGKSLPQANFSKSQVLTWGLSKATVQSKKDGDVWAV